MAGRGVHFSLSEVEAEEFRGLDRTGRIEHLFERVEPDYFANHHDRMAESDKAWDAMHRALTNGLLEYVGGDYPLTHVVLGVEGKLVVVAAALPSDRIDARADLGRRLQTKSLWFLLEILVG